MQCRKSAFLKPLSPLLFVGTRSLTAPFTRFISAATTELTAPVPRKQRDSLGKFPLQLGREEPVGEVLKEGAARRFAVEAEATLGRRVNYKSEWGAC